MSARLVSLPRVRLRADGPTPLHPARRLSEAIGIEVWLKRDDLTGFGLGGNKVRGLEYLLADAERRGCDCLVTGAGPQSNWAMLAALAARVRGLDAHLVYYGDEVPAQGNHLLAAAVGADIRFTGEADRTSVDACLARIAEELREAGRTPYVLPRGGAVPLGCVGYVQAALELELQLLEVGLDPGTLWLATGSCGTQAGLLAGVRWLRLGVPVVGVTVSRPVGECRARIAELASGATTLLGLDPPTGSGEPDVIVVGGYIGPGYGARSKEGEAAAALAARTEGVFLDPVFAAKALAGLIDAAEAGTVAGPVVFLCTGGAPALFSAPGQRP